MGATISPKGSIGLVTEFCGGGNLFNLLHESNVPLSWKQRCKMALDVAKGMNSLHSYKPPILHRDLKSLNLLLVESVKGPYDPVLVKITDLGLARFQSSNQYMTGMAGTFHWMAPEVLAGKPYTIKADIYSYAIVLWEIITRRKPYEDMDPRRIMHLVLNLNQRPEQTSIPFDCPPLVLLTFL
jgi:serine/threonine protein kinase